MHLKQRRLLAAIDDYTGQPDTSELRERTGIDSGQVTYHLEVLVDEGFAEVVGDRHVGAPVPANVYGLTSEGERRASELEAPTHPTELAVELDTLRERVDELELENSQLRDALEELNENVVAVASNVDGIRLE